MDERIAALLRAWQESGSPEDQRAYLLARCRAGELATVSLQVAAWLGDPVAAELLGDDAPRPPRTSFEKLMGEFPHEIDHLAYATTALASLEWISKEALLPSNPTLEADLTRLRDFLADPTYMKRLEFSRVFWLGIRVNDECTAGQIQRLRDHLRTVVVPWVLTRKEHADAERAQAAKPGLFSAAHCTPQVAEAVLACIDAKTKTPTAVESRAMVVAFLVALGWSPYRTSYLSPNGLRRVVLKRRTLAIQAGGKGAWDPVGPTAQFTAVARDLLAILRP